MLNRRQDNLEAILSNNSKALYAADYRLFRGIRSENSRFNYRFPRSRNCSSEINTRYVKTRISILS